jgi:hypothetical protein
MLRAKAVNDRLRSWTVLKTWQLGSFSDSIDSMDRS